MQCWRYGRTTASNAGDLPVSLSQQMLGKVTAHEAADAGNQSMHGAYDTAGLAAQQLST
jgi:hypothetical protein